MKDLKEWFCHPASKVAVIGLIILLFFFTFCRQGQANGEEAVVQQSYNNDLMYMQPAPEVQRTGPEFGDFIRIDEIALEYSTYDARGWAWLTVADMINVRIRHIGQNYYRGPRFKSINDITFNKTFDVQGIVKVDVWHSLSNGVDTTGLTVRKTW